MKNDNAFVASSRRFTAALAMFALVFSPACQGGPGGSVPTPGPRGDGALALGPAEPGATPSTFNPDDYIDPSESVGSLPGGLMVGPDGSARYRIDFQLAEEFGGNTPSLGLAYNGRTSGGDAGRGWSLSGLSSISRCPITSAAGPYLERPDGQALPDEGLRSPAGIEALDKDDLYSPDNGAPAGVAAAAERYSNLCLNGALLYQVPLDGTTPPPKAVRAFRVQGRPFARVFLSDNGSFEEHAESGLVRFYTGSRYARTSAGRMIRSFVLASEQDQYGNEVSYDYAWDGDDHDNHRLTGISYTGGRVELEWGESEERFGYFHGMRATSTALLQRVVVYGGDDGIARSYELTHSQSTFSDRLVLASATVCDRDEVCLPETRFEYTTPELTTDYLRAVSGFGVQSALVLTDSERETAAFTDVDGDGIADLVYLTETPVLSLSEDKVLTVRYGEGEGTFGAVREYDLAFPPGLSESEANGTSLRFADITGDGLADPVLVTGFREEVMAGREWGGLYAEVIDASDQDAGLFVKDSWRIGGNRPWGCSVAYEPCGGGDAAGSDPSWGNYNDDPYVAAGQDLQEVDGPEECAAPEPEDHCRAVVPLGLTFMDVDGDGAEEFLPCIGLSDFGEELKSEFYWANADEMYAFSGSGGHVPNGAFGSPADPESRQICGDWNNGPEPFVLIDVTGEGTRDLLTADSLPPSVVADLSYSTRSVEFGMEGNADSDLFVDLLQRYARFDVTGQESAIDGVELDPAFQVEEPPEDAASIYDGLFTSATRGGPSGDIGADLNGDGLIDLVRLEPSGGVVGDPGEADAFALGHDPTLACKFGTTESELPASAAVYFNRGDGGFDEGPKLDAFTWKDYCRRFMMAARSMDIDGDGRAEVLLPTQIGTSFEVLELSGSDELTLSPVAIEGPQVYWSRQRGRTFVADVEGDGMPSLVVAQPDINEGTSILHATSLSAPPDLLVAVTDGYGAETHVEYGAAGDVFTAVDCSSRGPDYQAHTPRWPLVSAIVRPNSIGGGVQRNEVDLHRYRGWCNGPVVYGGGFEQHVETAVVDVGAGVEPGVYSGFGTPVAMVTTTRDDYGFRMGTFRGDVTKREALSWFPSEGAFTYDVEEAIERAYVDGFLVDWGIEEFYENQVGVPLWHAVGVMGTRVADTSRFYTPGGCSLADGAMDCEASSAAERVYYRHVERSFDGYGLVRSSSSNSGDYCSDYEVLDWFELPFARRPKETLSREGKFGAGGCDFDDPNLAPFELHERWEFDSKGKTELHAVEEGDDIGVVTTYSWDGDGTLHAQTVTESQWAGEDRTWEYSYDVHGNVASATNPLGHTTSYFWEPDLGLLVGSLDTNAVLVTTRFDGFGRSTGGRIFAGINGPALSPGTTTRYERMVEFPSNSASPLRLVSLDASGAEQVVEFDEHGTPRYSETDVSNDLRIFTQVDDYWAGNGVRVDRSTPAAVGDSPGPVESVEYDLHGREVSRTPATTELGVGESLRRYGRRDVVDVDGNGESWTSVFGEAGELVSTLDAEGILTCFYYGAGVRLRDVVVNPASGACDGVIPSDSTDRTSTHYTYDALGRTISRWNCPEKVDTFQAANCADCGVELMASNSAGLV